MQTIPNKYEGFDYAGFDHRGFDHSKVFDRVKSLCIESLIVIAHKWLTVGY